MHPRTCKKTPVGVSDAIYLLHPFFLFPSLAGTRTTESSSHQVTRPRMEVEDRPTAATPYAVEIENQQSEEAGENETDASSEAEAEAIKKQLEEVQRRDKERLKSLRKQQKEALRQARLQQNQLVEAEEVCPLGNGQYQSCSLCAHLMSVSCAGPGKIRSPEIPPSANRNIYALHQGRRDQEHHVRWQQSYPPPTPLIAIRGLQ
jgi:hypothetical protein